jgi:hypothetical protein
MALHRELVVVVTVPRVDARLPLPDSLALGAQHGKLDADLRTPALLGTLSVQSVHDCYPFALGDGGHLAPMAAELVDRVIIQVAFRRFLGMGATDSRSLRFDNYVRMQHFGRRATYAVPFRRFLGNVRRESMQRLSAALHDTLGSSISATLCKMAVLMMWHAFLFLGLLFFPLFFFLLGGLR